MIIVSFIPVPDAVERIRLQKMEERVRATWRSIEGYQYLIQVYCDNVKVGQVTAVANNQFDFDTPHSSKEYSIDIRARYRGVNGIQTRSDTITRCKA